MLIIIIINYYSFPWEINIAISWSISKVLGSRKDFRADDLTSSFICWKSMTSKDGIKKIKYACKWWGKTILMFEQGLSSLIRQMMKNKSRKFNNINWNELKWIEMKRMACEPDIPSALSFVNTLKW